MDLSRHARADSPPALRTYHVSGYPHIALEDGHRAQVLPLVRGHGEDVVPKEVRELVVAVQHNASPDHGFRLAGRPGDGRCGLQDHCLCQLGGTARLGSGRLNNSDVRPARQGRALSGKLR